MSVLQCIGQGEQGPAFHRKNFNSIRYFLGEVPSHSEPKAEICAPTDHNMGYLWQARHLILHRKKLPNNQKPILPSFSMRLQKVRFKPFTSLKISLLGFVAAAFRFCRIINPSHTGKVEGDGSHPLTILQRWLHSCKVLPSSSPNICLSILRILRLKTYVNHPFFFASDAQSLENMNTNLQELMRRLNRMTVFSSTGQAEVRHQTCKWLSVGDLLGML